MRDACSCEETAKNSAADRDPEALLARPEECHASDGAISLLMHIESSEALFAAYSRLAAICNVPIPPSSFGQVSAFASMSTATCCALFLI